MNQDPNLNPYAPPESDVNGAIWPSRSAQDGLDQPAADRGSRLGAVLLDTLLYVAALIPGILVMIFGGRESMMPGAVVMGLCMLPLVIYQWYLVATTGQSISKKWLRIRIVKVDGSPVDFTSGVLLRIWVPYIILQVLAFAIRAADGDGRIVQLFSLIDALWIFGGQSRCVHDYIAGTKVVVA
jgi:uncharacterized RDD family membrane protein YckC